MPSAISGLLDRSQRGHQETLDSLLGVHGFMGPGLITSNVDNDAGGITTYSLAGARFGMTMLWSMVYHLRPYNRPGDEREDGRGFRQGPI